MDEVPLHEPDPGDPGLTIGEFSKRYGVSCRTIRFYEAAGLLNPTRIGKNRYFSRRDGNRMELTLKSKRLGFSLREIKQLIDAHVCGSQKEPDTITDILDKDKMIDQLKALEEQKKEIEAIIKQLKGSQSIK